MGALRLPFIITFLLLSFVRAEALDISATGGWNETVGPTDLISGAGSDLKSTYTSAEGATILNITRAWAWPWRVDVRRSDKNWPSGLTLYVRRRSDGSGHGSISGGTAYVSISTTDQTFFNGSGNRSGINCQYQLTGMSIDISPGTYSTTIIYTIIGRY